MSAPDAAARPPGWDEPLLARLPERDRALLLPRGDPRDAAEGGPMLAKLSSRRSFDDRWIFERKLDGVRALAVCDAGGVRLRSRTGRAMDATYPEVVQALAGRAHPDLAVDGEIVAMREGRTDFSLLQQRMGLTDPRAVRASPVAVAYYVFDLLALGGWDTTRLPQRTRKSLLRAALSFGDGPLRYTPHRNHDAEQGVAALLDQSCARGWEGLIAKRADAPYRRRRSDDWLKLKCAAGQELVVGGFTEPAGSRIGFGALLLGYYGHDGDGPAGDGGRDLRYAGKVGTGWSDRQLRELRERLESMRRSDCPFTTRPRERAARWVEPRLVAQVGFSEWTRDGLLRHPRFLGLREDVRPGDVRRERAAQPPAPGGP